VCRCRCNLRVSDRYNALIRWRRPRRGQRSAAPAVGPADEEGYLEMKSWSVTSRRHARQAVGCCYTSGRDLIHIRSRANTDRSFVALIRRKLTVTTAAAAAVNALSTVRPRVIPSFIQSPIYPSVRPLIQYCDRCHHCAQSWSVMKQSWSVMIIAGPTRIRVNNY